MKQLSKSGLLMTSVHSLLSFGQRKNLNCKELIRKENRKMLRSIAKKVNNEKMENNKKATRGMS